MLQFYFAAINNYEKSRFFRTADRFFDCDYRRCYDDLYTAAAKVTKLIKKMTIVERENKFFYVYFSSS